MLFWLPLGVMWLMMAAEQPALTAIVARLPDAERNLAAFGVVFAISLVIESPIIQMLAAATAVSGNTANYRLLLRFMHVFAVALTGLHLLIGLTPLYDLIVTGILNVPPDVTETSRLPFVVMAPFSAAVGYRRLWQGVLIRHGKTWVVPIVMIARLGLIAAVLAIGFASAALPGALLAAVALAAGVIVAAVAAGTLNAIMVAPRIPKPTPDDEVFSWRGLLRFYAPLAITSVVFLVSQPVITFGIARGRQPVLSLAVWPVINSFMFLFNSIGLSYQETAIALLKRSPASLQRLKRFTLGLALTLSGGMLFVALTPAAAWWFRVVSGLSENLLSLTALPVILLSAVPALLTYKAWYRGRYVTSGRTHILAQGVVAYTIVLFASVFAGAWLLPVAGATVASVAYVLAQAAENGYLLGGRPGRDLPARNTVAAESSG